VGSNRRGKGGGKNILKTSEGPLTDRAKKGNGFLNAWQKRKRGMPRGRSGRGVVGDLFILQTEGVIVSQQGESNGRRRDVDGGD